MTTGCHEAITTNAARRAGFPATQRAPTPTDDQARAMSDLTFTLADRDVWTMAMLIGVRSNDIRDNQPIDVARLVHIHNDPEDQPAHCMRSLEDDGPEGDASALASCRAFILAELAAGGLLEDTLDLETTERLPVYLAFRGRIELELPRFAVRLGKAMHALEDSYTHTFRDPGTDEVRHVGNWVDSITPATYNPVIDGYHHVGVLDDCTRDDAREQDRVERATSAVTRVLQAIAEPALGRRGRVEAALDRAFARQGGCVADNRYCDAQELDEEAGAGCTTSRGGTWLLALGVLAFVLQRARRSHRRSSQGVLAFVLSRGSAPIAGLVAALTAAPAHATPLWHFDARLGGALDHAAQATTVGAGIDFDRFTVGAAVEWNPWFSLDTYRAQRGTFNAYATLARRWYTSEKFSLYSRLELGSSTMLFELVGVDRYQTGFYFGGSLLGVRAPIGRGISLTFDPSHFTMPMPGVVGFPFYYRQYRITLGIEVTFS